MRSRIKRAATLMAVLFCAGALAALWRHSGRTGPASASRPAPSRPAPSAPARPEITFLVASDTHLGMGAPIEALNRAMIDRMNAMAGTPWPDSIGGRVGEPAALLLAGDLTESGGEAQWRLFTRFYGLRGGDGLLRWPVFEAQGNHDHALDEVVAERIAQRHRGPFYAFDLGGVHFASLGEAPDDRGLAFLAADLDGRPPETPTVLFFHLPLRGPWVDNWFSAGGFRERLGTLLQGHRILAIFHGHSHFSSAYRWNGIDVYNPGSVKHSQRAFLVVQIRDESMTVAAWNLDFNAWWWWRRVSLASSPQASVEASGRWAPAGFGPRPWLEFPGPSEVN